ncbi:molybdopterin-guanine dinucleotide biosynthesis protein B [Candidatus Latescibacterota bacterium]
MIADLSVFGICGSSGSGKTTLIEKLLPPLSARGLRVAVVKHHAHGIVVDTPGKDSDRFFRSGADVLLNGSDESFLRLHPSGINTVSYTLKTLCRNYDLVLVESRKTITSPNVWLLSENESNPPSDSGEIVAVLPRDSDRPGIFMSILDDWLPEQWLKTSVYGCVLIGGRSTRMSLPKYLIVENEKTWLERTVELLKQVAHRVVVVGAGAVPEGLTDIVRLPDIPEIEGPMAGILSAMRWAPYTSWLVTACDLPDLSLDALEWLLSTRTPGTWATLPKLRESKGIEPLLAHYDFRAHNLLEKITAEGILRPSKIAKNSNVITVSPPTQLTAAWRNINTKAELKSFRKSC